ncbi:ATP-dependent RNA helicase [Mactra antiquata]
MDDDIDAGLNLNISVPTKRPSFGAANQRGKISGSRQQRIKARRSQKKWNEKQKARTHSENSNVDRSSKPETKTGGKDVQTKSPQKDVDNQSSENKSEGNKKKPSGVVISSLFRHNPEIPTVKSLTVKQVKEDLFSSDSFQDTPLHPYMKSNLDKLGFSKMTSVQQETIPKLVTGHDVLVKSQTGSGKTMSYAIPIIENLCQQTPKIQRSDGCMVIVLVPTRELALQSYDVFVKLLKPFTWLVAGCIMGGENRKKEKARLRKGINILIATPGRLIDHIENTQNLLLGKIKWLVLDEADRLLDLGFEEKVAKIIKAIDSNQSSERQTVLLSATLSQGVERLAGMSLKDPQRVSISDNTVNSRTMIKDKPNISKATDNAISSPDHAETGKENENYALPESLKQYFVITPCKLRLVVLLILILSKCKRSLKTKMLVFVSTQDGVEFLYRLVTYLSKEHNSDSDVEEEEEDKEQKTNLDVFRLHGDMSQKDRTSTYQNFCTANSGVLICTDVAARGLHLPFVQWVVQYSCSTGVTDYIHRVGRTARAGTTGNSVMFLMPSEIDFIKHLNQRNISIEEWKLGVILKDVTRILPMLPGQEETQRQAPKTVEESATYLQNCCELFVKNGKDMSGLAKSAYQSYIRAYATYPHDLKPVFHLRNLHLGHVAKTFGLREAPSNIANIPGVNTSSLQRKRKLKDDSKKQVVKKPRHDTVSEFKSPLMFTKKTKKNSKGKQRTKKVKVFQGKIIKKKKTSSK